MNAALRITGLSVLAALLLMLVWLRTGLIGSERWPIAWLDVEGDLDRTTATQVRAAVSPAAVRGFFAVDMDEIRRLVEALPWVAAAEVSRHWPDTLHVRIVEHRPVARWNRTGLISSSGQIFDVAGSSGMQGLVRLAGPEARFEEVVAGWQRMQLLLAGVGLEIERLELDARGSWQLVLEGGPVLLLGREQVEPRLQRFIGVYTGLSNQQLPIAVVDLRYTNGLALRRHELLDQPRETEAEHG